MGKTLMVALLVLGAMTSEFKDAFCKVAGLVAISEGFIEYIEEPDGRWLGRSNVYARGKDSTGVWWTVWCGWNNAPVSIVKFDRAPEI